MSKIVLAPNASGTGTLTIAAPDTSTNRTLTLPDNSGTVQTQLDQGFSFRNRIINGDMRIDQRNAGASVTASTTGTNVYLVDRWCYNVSQASKFTAQQNAGAVTPPAGFTNYLGFTSSSAYSVLSGDYLVSGQILEGFNVADLGWGAAGAQSVTLSFWVRSSLTGTFGGALSNSAQNRSYPFSYTISAANTWEQKTLVIAGDTSGTWLTTNGIGVRLWFGLGVGSTYSGTAGSWSGSTFLSATGAVSVVGTSGATFYITGVQLEAGSVASTFERRPYGTELALCQRYYETANNPFYLALVSGNQVSAVGFKVTKRANPTVTSTGSTPSVINVSVSGASFVRYGSTLTQIDSWVASSEL